MPNLKEQIEAYANYLITAGVTAILAVGGTLGVQAIKHHFNPGPINQNEFSVNMLNNGIQARSDELQAELDQLNAEEAPFAQAVTDNHGDPNALPAADAAIPEGQAPALTAAYNALRTFREQNAARRAALGNIRAGYARLNTFLETEGNPAVLEDAIRHAARVAPTAPDEEAN